MRFNDEVRDAMLEKAGALFDQSLRAAKDGHWDRAHDDHDAGKALLDSCVGEK